MAGGSSSLVLGVLRRRFLVVSSSTTTSWFGSFTQLEVIQSSPVVRLAC